MITELSNSRTRGSDVDGDGAARTSDEEVAAHYQRYDYQYDDRGNWTERVVWGRTGSQPEFQRANIERRMITYFEP
jgi:hypothetical protein